MWYGPFENDETFACFSGKSLRTKATKIARVPKNDTVRGWEKPIRFSNRSEDRESTKKKKKKIRRKITKEKANKNDESKRRAIACDVQASFF